MLKAIHAQEDKEAAKQKATLVAEKLRTMKLDKVADFVEKSVDETLSYMDFPYEHWSRLRTNNGLERIMKEIRRRTRVVGSFPDGYSAMMLVGARLRHISTTKWGTRQYMNTCKLYEDGVKLIGKRFGQLTFGICNHSEQMCAKLRTLPPDQSVKMVSDSFFVDFDRPGDCLFGFLHYIFHGLFSFL